MTTLLQEAEKAAAQLPALTLRVDKVANTPVLGTHGRKKAGMGESFWQYDEYRPGLHEIKRIAWRESAKGDKTYVRQNEWEAAQAAYIWCDNSPEMDFSSAPQTRRTKNETAQIIALALTRALVDADERVALLGGRGLLSTRLPAIAAELQDRPQSDSQAWQNLATQGRPPLRNGTVILISDFMADPAVIEDAIGRLASRGIRGHMIQVLDPAELNLPYNGHVEFDDFRGGKLRLPKAEDMRALYFERLRQQQQAVLALAERAGWRFSCHLTSNAPHEALAPLFTQETPPLPRFEDGADPRSLTGRNGQKDRNGQKSNFWQRLRGGPAP